MNVVLLDLWTDANRGDAALQLGLIDMVRDRWPGCRVSGVFRFGLNEIEDARPEIALTTAALDLACGGLRRTHYAAARFGRFGKLAHQILSLYSFLELGLILLIARLVGLRMLLPRRHVQVIRLLAEADVVIWKGKNFRSYGGLAGIKRQSTLLVAGLIGQALNSNVHCVNASVWNMAGGLERRIVAKTLSGCRSVTVRDRDSLANARRLCGVGARVHFAQDLSFYCLARDFAATGQRRCERPIRYDLALTLTEWGNEAAQAAYVDSVALTIKRLKTLGLRSAILVPQVTRVAESNARVVARLLAQIEGVEITVAEGAPDIGQLLDIYEECGMLLGTRLHSCVFARSVGTPFVAIAYDAGPKWEILSEFWERRYVFDYASPAEHIAEAVVELFVANLQGRVPRTDGFATLAGESLENISGIPA